MQAVNNTLMQKHIKHCLKSAPAQSVREKTITDAPGQPILWQKGHGIADDGGRDDRGNGIGADGKGNNDNNYGV